jgi:pimeloyl-ACP methyl ester carboxylesterase
MKKQFFCRMATFFLCVFFSALLVGCLKPVALRQETPPPQPFVHFSKERNPQRLLDVCGIKKPTSHAQEQFFLETLRMHSPSELKTLFLVVGGFLDGTCGYAYEIVQAAPDLVQSQCDIFYREYDEGSSVRELLQMYAKAGKKIILVGHNWGGQCLLEEGVMQDNAPVDLLVTLDPAGYAKPREAPSTLKRWINIYIEYSNAPLDISAMMGRVVLPWGNMPLASENTASVIALYNKPLAMFQNYAQDAVLALLKKPAPVAQHKQKAKARRARHL